MKRNSLFCKTRTQLQKLLFIVFANLFTEIFMKFARDDDDDQSFTFLNFKYFDNLMKDFGGAKTDFHPVLGRKSAQ